MTYFIKNLPISFTTIYADRSKLNSQVDLIVELSSKLNMFIKENLPYFQKFDVIKIYYDEGQKPLIKILKLAFETWINNIEENFDADPNFYTLFQVADTLS